jgi:hypothetical protein
MTILIRITNECVAAATKADSLRLRSGQALAALGMTNLGGIEKLRAESWVSWIFD